MLYIIRSLTFICLIISVFTAAVNSGNKIANKDLTPFDHSHASYSLLLKKHVKNGFVDYNGFISDEDRFKDYLDSLSQIELENYSLWTRNQKISFWINAYNAFTIKAIIDNYPIKRSWTLVGLFYAPENSILQIPGVWKKLQFNAVGKEVTLDEIEHKILRKEFDEPRIHAAIVCASISCPDLRNEPYIHSKLDYQLDHASLKFVNDSSKGVKLEADSKKIKISKIFKWFREDFSNYSDLIDLNMSEKKQGVLGFIYKFTESEEIRSLIKSNDIDISYLGYDWSLNDKQQNK